MATCNLTPKICNDANPYRKGPCGVIVPRTGSCFCRCSTPVVDSKPSTPKPKCHNCSLTEAVRTNAKDCCNYSPSDIRRDLDVLGNPRPIPSSTNLAPQDMDCAGYGGFLAPFLEPLCVAGKSATKGAQGAFSLQNFLFPMILLGGGILIIALLK